jgi:hypothetical protein
MSVVIRSYRSAYRFAGSAGCAGRRAKNLAGSLHSPARSSGATLNWCLHTLKGGKMGGKMRWDKARKHQRWDQTGKFRELSEYRVDAILRDHAKKTNPTVRTGTPRELGLNPRALGTNPRAKGRACADCGKRRGERYWISHGEMHDGSLNVFTFCGSVCRDRWRANNPFRLG